MGDYSYSIIINGMGKVFQWLFFSRLHKCVPGSCASFRMLQSHEYSPFQDNQYLQAIKSVGSVLVPYDSDQMIPAFGFGAQVPSHFEVSHCFPLDLNTHKPEVYGVQVLPSSTLGSIVSKSDQSC